MNTPVHVSELEEKDKKTGTKEWATTNINIANGCAHDCRYCYAREMKMRFNFFNRNEKWQNETILWDRVNARIGQVKKKTEGLYDIMFPSTHDITPTLLEPSLIVIKKILLAGNSVLIVSKPHTECITEIVRLLSSVPEWKDRVLFRFTITSKDNSLLSYWERNAPLFEERFEALQYCYREGYKTSVSIEPCLDLPKVSALVSTISPFVTEHIWIGIMKSVRLRVEVTTEEDKAMVTELLRAQSRDNVLRIYHQLKDDKKIMWKDSIKKIVEKAG